MSTIDEEEALFGSSDEDEVKLMTEDKTPATLSPTATPTATQSLTPTPTATQSLTHTPIQQPLNNDDDDDDEDEDLFGDDDVDIRNTSTKIDGVIEKSSSSMKSKSFSDIRNRNATLNLGPSVEFRDENLDVKIRADNDSELCHIKLPTWLGMESRAFDRNQMLSELEGVPSDELGEHAAPQIRWRNVQDSQEGQSTRQSNAQLLRWSDGSIQLMVGSLVLDVADDTLQPRHFLFKEGVCGSTHDAEASDLKLCQAQFTRRLRVQATQSWRGRRANRNTAPAIASIKKLHTKIDPEIEMRMRAKEYERRQALNRRDDKRYEIRRPRLPTITPHFLEDECDEDISSEEEFKSSSRTVSRRKSYNNDDDDGNQRLQDAKLGSAVVKGRASAKRRRKHEYVSTAMEVNEVSTNSVNHEDDDEDNASVAPKKKYHQPTKRKRVIEESDSE